MKLILINKKNKIKEHFKKYKYEYFSFVFPIIIFLFGLFMGDIIPIGKNIITFYDGKVQYPGFASYFAEVLRGNESFFYSFKGSLGFNFYAAAIYYLINPTNLLLIFFNFNNMQIFYCITIMLRIGLSGFTMFTFLKYNSQKNIYKVLFSMAFALSGYNIIYFSNYMWFDSIVLFPIVLLGIKKLIYERKNYIYFISLFFCIIFNFYIGYMICIFSLLYFIYLYILLDKDKKNKQIIFDFFITSLLAGVSCAITIIPIIKELLIGKAIGYADNFTNYIGFDWDAIKIFYKFTPGNFSILDISYGSPNVYCSLFAIVLTIFYFFNKNIKTKEKIISLIFLLFYALSFTFNLIDYSWHMFQKPIWYPARYSFTFIAFLICLADKAMSNVKDINISTIKSIISCIILCSLILFGAYKSNIITPTPNVSKYIFFFLSFLIILQYFIIIKHYNKIFKKFILVLFIIELTANTLFSLKTLGNKTSYYINQTIIKNNQKFLDYIKQNEEENNFYRIYTHTPYINNNGLYFNYNGINFFSSVRNNGTISFLENYLGVTVGDHVNISWQPENMILNSLFSIKYLTTSSKTENVYQYLDSDTSYYIYKNDDAANIAFMTYDNLNKLEELLTEKNYTENINFIAKYLSNQDSDIITKVDYTLENLVKNGDLINIVDNNQDAKISYSIKNSKRGYIILPTVGINDLKGTLLINGEEISEIHQNKFAYYVESGSNIDFSFNLKYSLNAKKTEFYFIDYDNYNKFISEIKENEFNITEYKKDDYIKGTITATKEKNVMFTTISADEGWSIYVDGEKEEYDTFKNALITLKLDEGTHTIEFKYFPSGLKEGIIISSITLLISAYYLINKNRN